MSEVKPASLQDALVLAGWGPRDLVRAVNALLASRGRSRERIDATAAYPWVREGYCPHGAVPELVATVLSTELGTFVSAADLWPDHARAQRSTRHALDLTGMRTIDDAVRGLSQLASGAEPLPTDGPDLVAAVLDGLDPIPDTDPRSSGHDRVMASQADLIAQHVQSLRHLDDQQGGGALSLRYVTHELVAVLDLLRSTSYDQSVRDQLLSTVTDLAQLAGWMQFHAGHSRIAQPYLLLAARVARANGDSGRMVNNMGMLAYVATYGGQAAQALQIVKIACNVDVRGARVQARAVGRAATAHAAAGDLAAFQTARDDAQQLLTDAARDDASYLYYLDMNQLDAEAGHGFISVALHATAFQKRLLRQAVELLTPVTGPHSRPGFERSALLHGCHLARAQLLLRDLDGAIDSLRTALTRLPAVQSGRCLGMLRELRRDLAQRQRAQCVADFLPELDHALH